MNKNTHTDKATRANDRAAFADHVYAASEPKCHCNDNFDSSPCMAHEADAKRQARNERARLNRRFRDEVMRSCGLTKVKGNLGGTYWE